MFDRGAQRIPSGLQVALALLGVPAVAAISAFWLAEYLSDSLLRRDAELTRQLVQSAVASHEAAPFFARPSDEASAVGFERFLDQVMRLPDVTRANVYTLAGEVIWSSSRELIGEVFADNDELQRASLGALVVESGQLEASDKSEHIVFDRVVEQWFVESYIPIRDAGTVIGVVELYKLPGALSVTLNNVRLIIWVSATFVAVLLAGSVLWLRATRPSRDAAAQGAPATSDDTDPSAPSTPSPTASNRSVAEAVHRPSLEPLGADRMPAAERATGDRHGSSRRSRWSRPPPRWGLASTALALVLSTPVVFGIYVMHAHGVERNGTLGELADQEQSLLPFAASAAALLLVPPSSTTMLADESVATGATGETPADLSDLSDDALPDLPATAVADASLDTTPPVGNATHATEIVPPAPVVGPLDDEERVFWESIVDSDDPMLYQAYLDRYPDGAFDVIARRWLEARSELHHDAIEEMLALGWQAYDRDSLSVPEHDSAMKWARQVLAIEPAHSGALDLARTVIDTYLQWGVQANASGRAPDVTRHLRRAQSLYRHATAEQLTMMAALQDALQNARNIALDETTRAPRSGTDPASDVTLASATSLTGTDASSLDDAPIDSPLRALLDRLQTRLAARERSR